MSDTPEKSGLALSAWALVVVAACFGVGIWLSNWPLPPNPALATNPFPGVISTLGTLAVLAVFVERTVEVYAVSVREPHKVTLESEVVRLRGSADTVALRTAESKLTAYQAGTQKRAVLFALALGLLLGLFGISILSSIFASPVDVVGIPYRYLRVLDVVIVGGLLAGGADPIHQMIKALQDGAELSRTNTALASANAKAAAETAAKSPPPKT